MIFVLLRELMAICVQITIIKVEKSTLKRFFTKF